MDQHELGSLIDSLYDCVLEPQGWSAFLVELAEGLRATAPGMAVGEPGAHWQVHALVEEKWSQIYGQRYGRQLIERALEESLVGSSLEIAQLARETMERWDFYAEWMKPQKHQRGIGWLVPLDDTAFLGIGLYRGPAGPSFETADLAVLEAVKPHLTRAVQLARRLPARDAPQTIESILDRLELGVVLLDQRGRILVANDTAQHVARRGDGLGLSAEHLWARDPAAQRRLEALVRGVALGPPEQGASAGGAVRVPRTGAERPYEVLVSPAPGHGYWPERRAARVLVLIRDPASISAPSLELLGALYALTPAEARVAAGLACGRSIEEMARGARVTERTVRNQLKAVFDKTDTHRQAELASLLRASLAALAPDPRTRSYPPAGPARRLS